MWDRVNFRREMVYPAGRLPMRSHSDTQKETYTNVVQRATTGAAQGHRDSLAQVEPQSVFPIATYYVLAPECPTTHRHLRVTRSDGHPELGPAQLVAIGREQNPSVIRVIFSRCADEDDPLDGEPADIPEPLRPDRAWNDELHSLLEIVHKAEGVIEGNPRRGSAKELIAALARLTNLVLKQQRHLQELEPEEEQQIEVIYERGDAIGRSDEIEAPHMPQPGEMEVFSEDQ